MTIEQAKQIDLVDYLDKLGHTPTRISGNSYWYLSPLRDEKTASFKVNRNRNQWYDFADGKGGNLIDFGILYHKCSVSDLLQRLAQDKLIPEKQILNSVNVQKIEKERNISIISTAPITSLPLIRYYRSRRIADEMARKCLKEVNYENQGKAYYALGFQNDSGGWELRNEYSKVSSTPKDLTFINNGANKLVVFEGFFDYLSFLTIHHKQQQDALNFMVLNSTAFFEKALEKMAIHHRIHLYLDNDTTGQKCVDKVLPIDAKKFIDERQLYKGYNDLNEWLQKIGLAQKKSLRQHW